MAKGKLITCKWVLSLWGQSMDPVTFSHGIQRRLTSEVMRLTAIRSEDGSSNDTVAGVSPAESHEASQPNSEFRSSKFFNEVRSPNFMEARDHFMINEFSRPISVLLQTLVHRQIWTTNPSGCPTQQVACY